MTIDEFMEMIRDQTWLPLTELPDEDVLTDAGLFPEFKPTDIGAVWGEDNCECVVLSGRTLVWSPGEETEVRLHLGPNGALTPEDAMSANWLASATGRVPT